MKHFELNLEKVNHWAIAGNSGSGKSYALTYFLSVLKHMSDLIIIDPKFDTPSRWAKGKSHCSYPPCRKPFKI